MSDNIKFEGPQDTTLVSPFSLGKPIKTLVKTRNSGVPDKYQTGVFMTEEKLKKFLDEKFPREIHTQIKNGFESVGEGPFQHKATEPVIAVIADVYGKVYEYRMFVSDPMNHQENGTAYYMGQGYAPNVFFVRRTAGQSDWYYV